MLDEGLKQRLASGKIDACKLIPWGSNYTFAVTIEDDLGTLTAIYKPERGEIPLWDFESGTLYRREYASYLLSCLLGWYFIPPTVIREGPHGIGTVQLYIEPDNKLGDAQLRDEFAGQLRCMTLFDLMANNADRKSSHYFVGSERRQLWGIDHGLTFHAQPKLRTVIWDFCGTPLDDDLSDTLGALTDNPRQLRKVLSPYISRSEITMLLHRASSLRQEGIFPFLNPRRNVPYGW